MTTRSIEKIKMNARNAGGAILGLLMAVLLVSSCTVESKNGYRFDASAGFGAGGIAGGSVAGSSVAGSSAAGSSMAGRNSRGGSAEGGQPDAPTGGTAGAGGHNVGGGAG